MSQSAFFARLGARLTNVRSSWGSVRSSDGAVFLRVWQDGTRRHDGSLFVQITHNKNFQDDPDNPGHQERLKHVELIRQGAPCYMIMCQAVDVDAKPRELKDFNNEQVFPGGKLAEFDGDWWIELLTRIPFRQAMPAASSSQMNRS